MNVIHTLPGDEILESGRESFLRLEDFFPDLRSFLKLPIFNKVCSSKI